MNIEIDETSLETLSYTVGERVVAPALLTMMEQKGKGEHDFAEFYAIHWADIWGMVEDKAYDAVNRLEQAQRKGLFYLHQDQAMEAFDRHTPIINQRDYPMWCVVCLLAEMLHKEWVLNMVDNPTPM